MALSALLDGVPHARTEALELARFACQQTSGALHRELAELAEFPAAPFEDAEQLEEAREACARLAELLLSSGNFRQRVDKRHGFPVDAKAEKNRLLALIADLRNVPGIEQALVSIGELPPARYTEEEWTIVRACFTLLRHAAAQLKVAFAASAAVDYTEVAQIAQQIMKGEEGIPGEAALARADEIRHLLVDEFQDTSRRQHELLWRLIAAWPEREGRTCFVVGDPMQSIYFFRDADAELFPRVRENGLEIPEDQPLVFHPVALTANFRTEQSLVKRLNEVFERVFAETDGSGVTFAPAEAARNAEGGGPRLVAVERTRLNLHFDFMPQGRRARPAHGAGRKDETAVLREAAGAAQIQEIVALIGSHTDRMERAREEGRKYRIAILARTHASLRPIAEALRASSIPFRALELEKLKARPEVIDALALARALLNPHDRVAWLGVLRAPWCGLSLADLHLVAGADDVELQKRPIPELLAERAQMLSGQGRLAVERVRQAIEDAAALRAARPAFALGTWLEQVWLSLGGAACVDAAAKVNLDLLWCCLDGLPNGEQDVLGPALDAALDKFTALPDPAASSDCGVQLMTIHKAKGLEFEIVIVPELQARSGRTAFNLLSWLERGLEAPDEPGEITEFLIAPIPPKGAERGRAKAWVDAMRRQKEKQEVRRLLYVAATRAREELHLFARPEYKSDAHGSPELVEPKDCLLAAAWPALEEDVRKLFEAESSTVSAIAAGAENVIEMPPAQKPTMLRRLPPDFKASGHQGARPAAESIRGMSDDPFYRRHEGGLLSRALGIAVHRYLEELARLRETQEWDEARKSAAVLERGIGAQVRGAGIEPGLSRRMAAQGLEIALQASHDPLGQWVLSPHPGAANELRWAGVVGQDLREVQVDRVFRAGDKACSDGDEAWWIIDYKTAHRDRLDPEKALPELHEIFAPQLEMYARVLRNLRGADTRILRRAVLSAHDEIGLVESVGRSGDRRYKVRISFP